MDFYSSADMGRMRWKELCQLGCSVGVFWPSGLHKSILIGAIMDQQDKTFKAEMKEFWEEWRMRKLKRTDNEVKEI